MRACWGWGQVFGGELHRAEYSATEVQPTGTGGSITTVTDSKYGFYYSYAKLSGSAQTFSTSATGVVTPLSNSDASMQPTRPDDPLRRRCLGLF